MKEKLRCPKACDVVVCHEASAFRTVVPLVEMWQRSVMKSESDSLTFNILLSHAPHDLRNVDMRALRPGTDHVLDFVRLYQLFVCKVTSFISRLVQRLVHLLFEALKDILT